MSRVELYRETIQPAFTLDRKIKWRWRYISNGHIMADSAQGYSRRIDCLNACAKVLGGWTGPVFRTDWIAREVHHDIETVPVRDLTRKPTP